MTRRQLRLSVSGILIASVIVVGLRAPAAITVGTGSDTLVVNGTSPVSLGARAINRLGFPIWRPGLRYSGIPANLGRADRGAVTCTGNTGDATLVISHGRVEHRLFVRCRPIQHWGWTRGFTLEVGGEPKELAFEAYGYDRSPITLLRGSAAIRDSSVAVLKDGLIYPLRVGTTTIDAEFSGGTRTLMSVVVQHTEMDTTLRVAGGELRAWQFPAGFYELQLDVPDTTSAGPKLAVGITGSNCARGRAGRQHYYCLTTDSSVVIVRNLNARGGRAESGHLSIVRKPHKNFDPIRTS